MVKLLQTGVYCIRNKVNGKRYVGSASHSLTGRWEDHLKRLRGKYHYNVYLQRAWNKYREKSFKFEVLERCPPKKCIGREQFWMDKFRSYKKKFGYNGTPTAGSQLGYRHDAKGRKKIADGRNANWPGHTEAGLKKLADVSKAYWADPKHRAARVKSLRRAAKRPGVQEKKSAKLRGRPISDEARRKISESSMGKVIGPAQRAKASLATKAQWERDRERMTEHNRRIATDPVIRAKASATRKGTPAWNKGKKMTDKQKAKMTATARTPERCLAVSMARKAYWKRRRLLEQGVG